MARNAGWVATNTAKTAIRPVPVSLRRTMGFIGPLEIPFNLASNNYRIAGRHARCGGSVQCPIRYETFAPCRPSGTAFRHNERDVVTLLVRTEGPNIADERSE